MTTHEKEPLDGEGRSQIFPETDWRHKAANRLVKLLKRDELAELAAGIEGSLRSMRRMETGRDAPSTKWELAESLMVCHDADLFAQKPIREAVAVGLRREGFRADAPDRWISGRQRAVEFVARVDFPEELAGEPATDKPSELEIIRPPARFLDLEDFQKEVVDTLTALLAGDTPGRAIVSLPTGAGKTRVAVSALHAWMNGCIEDAIPHVTAVWLAHTEELCEQACECFRDVWESNPNGLTSVVLCRFWGEYTANVVGSLDEVRALRPPLRVIVATPQSYLRQALEVPAVREALLWSLRCVIVDEAHRASAPTYRTIIDAHRDEPIAFFGLTATPFSGRSNERDREAETAELRGVFNNNIIEPTGVLGPEPRQTLQERKVLARPVTMDVRSQARLQIAGLRRSQPTADQIEDLDKRLAADADTNSRRRIIINEIGKVCHDNPAAHVLYFGPTVRDAELVAFLLRREHVAAAAVSGLTSRSTRRRLIDDFRRATLQVLCNCEVLTTGFDAPTVTHVVVGRPTFSPVLYEQMVGRGLRGPRFGGTETCTIIDIIDEMNPDRPLLGRETFRENWEPESWLADKENPLAFRLISGTSVFEHSKGDGFWHEHSFPLERERAFSIELALIGAGVVDVLFQFAAEGARTAIIVDEQLTSDRPVKRLPGRRFVPGRLTIGVKTSHRASYVDVHIIGADERVTSTAVDLAPAPGAASAAPTGIPAEAANSAAPTVHQATAIVPTELPDVPIAATSPALPSASVPPPSVARSVLFRALWEIAPDYVRSKCPHCTTMTTLVVSREKPSAVMRTCANRGCGRFRQRLPHTLAQDLLAAAAVKCFHCGASEFAVEDRNWGTNVRCARCGTNNSWGGIDDRLQGRLRST